MENTREPPVITAWPVPPEWPLYVSIDQAAKIAGVSYDMMTAWANSIDPIPHIRSGRKKLIRVSAIPEYAQKQERR